MAVDQSLKSLFYKFLYHTAKLEVFLSVKEFKIKHAQKEIQINEKKIQYEKEESGTSNTTIIHCIFFFFFNIVKKLNKIKNKILKIIFCVILI